MLDTNSHDDVRRSLQPSGSKPPQPCLHVPPALEALVPAVAGVVTACCQGAPDAKRLAAELLRFLHLKVTLQDVGPVYLLQPPPLIDCAWQALLLETAVAEEAHAALGVDVVHRTVRQPVGAAAHAARRCATFTAAAHASAQQPGHASTTALSMPDALYWGVPARSDLLVRVTLLPLAAAHPRPVHHAWMPLQSSVADLAAQLAHHSGVALERFRPSGPAGMLLHPSKLLRCVDVATTSGNGGGNHHLLQLFATPTANSSSSGMHNSVPVGVPQSLVSLKVNGQQLWGLDGRASLSSLLLDRKLPCCGPPSTALTYFYSGSPPYDQLVLDETQPLAHFRGAHLQTANVEAPAVSLPVTVQLDAQLWQVRADLPEAWTMADLTNWMHCFGAATLYVDGAPARKDLSHASQFTRLVVVDVKDSATGGGGQARAQLFLRDLGGRMHTLEVKLCWTVWRMKFLVRDRTGIAVDMQRLLYAGRQLEDCRTLEDYNIKTWSNLNLMLRLRGC